MKQICYNPSSQTWGEGGGCVVFDKKCDSLALSFPFELIMKFIIFFKVKLKMAVMSEGNSFLLSSMFSLLTISSMQVTFLWEVGGWVTGHIASDMSKNEI